MSNQFLRKLQLIVADVTGAGLDLSQFKIVFKTEQSSSVQMPDNALIQVFNVGDATARKLLRPVPSGPEFSRLVLQAGYQNRGEIKGNYGIIFDGTIKQVRRRMLNATDSVIELYAADGDIAYNQGFVTGTIAGGAANTGQARLKMIIDGFKKVAPDTNVRYGPDVALGTVFPRGKTFMGLGRIYMRRMSDTTFTTWSFSGGNVDIISQTSYVGEPSEATVINVQTGMVGIPEQTDNGITVTCLLNPTIKSGGLIKLNNNDIAPGLINIEQTALQNLAPFSTDGFYKVLVAEHHGDTRGHDWYTHLVCLAVDMTQPKKNSVKPFGDPQLGKGLEHFVVDASIKRIN